MTYDEFLYTIIIEALRCNESPSVAVRSAVQALEQFNTEKGE